MSSKRSTVSVFLAAALLLPLAACGNGAIGAAIRGALSPDPNAERWGEAGPQALPADFPLELRYPNATLQAAPAAPTAQPITADLEPIPEQTTRWVTADSNTQVQDFYRNLFQTPAWTLQDQATNGDETTFAAQRQDLQVTVSIPNRALSAPPTGSAAGNSPAPVGAEFVVQYIRGGVAAAEPPAPEIPATNSPSPTVPEQFTDLDQAPKELQPYLEALAELGVLTPGASQNNPLPSETLFQPNQTVTRREFTRWLVEANNRIYRDQPGRQIRPVSEAPQPAFKDVPRTDPAFPFVQGLAEAGYIPSSLSGAANTGLFRPNAPLTREELLLWKVPIDIRRILPTATLEGVRNAWGFQDSSRIDPKALRAVSADHQNGDLSNIRRVFGSTLLLQPKKPVTRAEAAVALWYIGAQGEGLSAQDVLEAERQGAGSSPEPAPPSPENQANN